MMAAERSTPAVDAAGSEAAQTRLEELAAIERELLAELDRDRLLRLVLQRVADLFAGPASGHLLEGDQLRPWHQAGADALRVPLAVGEGVTGQCVLRRRGVLVNDYAGWPHAVPVAVTRGLEHVMSQPLLVRDELIGAITVARVGRGAAPFTDADLAVLGLVAARVALALRNATLYEETRARRRAAEELARIARTLTGILDVASVGAQVVESVVSLFGCSAAGVGLLQPDHTLTRLAIGGPAALRLPRHLVLDSSLGLIGRALEEQRPCWSADLLQESGLRMSEDRRRLFSDAGLRAALVTPLRYRGRTIGALLIAFAEARGFSDFDVELAQAFGDQAAVALGNARLYEEAGRRRQEAEFAVRIARTLNSSLDLDVVLQRVVEGARELCRSDLARIALADPGSGAMVFRYWVNSRYTGYGSIRVTPGMGLGGRVLATRRPFRTDNWAEDPRISKETLSVIHAEGIVSQLAVPIMAGDHVEGLLYVDNREPRPFTDRDEAVLVGLADHAAVAIRNAQLFAAAQTTRARLQSLSAQLLQVQEAERRHLARELHDEVGQALTAVRINLLMLKRGADPGSAAGRIDDSLAIVERILAGVRQLSLDLRPSLLDDLGLAAALRWYVDAQAQRAGLTAAVIIDALDREPGPDLAITCFRVAQEAVTNVVRHAAARRIELELRQRSGALELAVRDDGVGFDVTAARERAGRGASLGLLGLEERVEMAGGRVSIDSSPSGTEIRVSFPDSDPAPTTPAPATPAPTAPAPRAEVPPP